MERCDFSSVAATIRRYISDDHYYNQIDFIGNLFADFLASDEAENFVFDNGSVCKWLNGMTKVSPQISRYYLKPQRQSYLEYNIVSMIIPVMNDPAMAVQALYELLVGDYTVSEEKKEALCKGYPCKTTEEKASFMAALLYFGMQREFVKRDSRKRNLLSSGSFSPQIADLIFGEELPKPCRYFCGREKELSAVHDLLIDQGKVFLHGIAGIGKSEVAKAYAKQHRKEYTNILYIPYSGDLKKDITNLDFADDRASDTEKERFRKHNRFLRGLKEDTLIIIDNFNALPTEDTFLPVVLKYHCRVLFTTRSAFTDQPGIEIREIEDVSVLIHFISRFYSDTEKNRQVIEEILEVVHRHTLAVELIARLLEKGILLPKKVLSKLQEEHASFSASDRITLAKDGRSLRATYYEHIRTLFSLFRLTSPQKDIMRNLSMVPRTGIPARLFAKWMLFKDLNELNDLIEMGLVRDNSRFRISLHPMIREVTISSLSPGISNCGVMLQSIRENCLFLGVTVSFHSLLFQVVENIAADAVKDDRETYLLLLEDVFPFMHNYGYTAGMQLVVSELEKSLGKTVNDASHHALLLLYHGELSDDKEQGIEYIQEALRLLPDVRAENAALISNLHHSLGSLYQETGEVGLALNHMETAAEILRQFDLIYTHDSVTQTIDYSHLLKMTGRWQQGLRTLLSMEKALRSIDHCSLDYALILESIGFFYLSMYKTKQAAACFRRLIEVYYTLFEDEEHLIEEKIAEIEKALQKCGQPLQKS